MKTILQGQGLRLLLITLQTIAGTEFGIKKGFPAIRRSTTPDLSFGKRGLPRRCRIDQIRGLRWIRDSRIMRILLPMQPAPTRERPIHFLLILRIFLRPLSIHITRIMLCMIPTIVGNMTGLEIVMPLLMAAKTITGINGTSAPCTGPVLDSNSRSTARLPYRRNRSRLCPREQRPNSLCKATSLACHKTRSIIEAQITQQANSCQSDCHIKHIGRHREKKESGPCGASLMLSTIREQM